MTEPNDNPRDPALSLRNQPLQSHRRVHNPPIVPAPHPEAAFR